MDEDVERAHAAAQRAAEVAALEYERDGYLRAGDKDRAAEVDRVLAYDAPKGRRAVKGETA